MQGTVRSCTLRPLYLEQMSEIRMRCSCEILTFLSRPRASISFCVLGQGRASGEGVQEQEQEEEQEEEQEVS